MNQLLNLVCGLFILIALINGLLGLRLFVSWLTEPRQVPHD